LKSLSFVDCIPSRGSQATCDGILPVCQPLLRPTRQSVAYFNSLRRWEPEQPEPQGQPEPREPQPERPEPNPSNRRRNRRHCSRRCSHCNDRGNACGHGNDGRRGNACGRGSERGNRRNHRRRSRWRHCTRSHCNHDDGNQLQPFSSRPTGQYRQPRQKSRCPKPTCDSSKNPPSRYRNVRVPKQQLPSYVLLSQRDGTRLEETLIQVRPALECRCKQPTTSVCEPLPIAKVIPDAQSRLLS
jgi:hypothetical protein